VATIRQLGSSASVPRHPELAPDFLALASVSAVIRSISKYRQLRLRFSPKGHHSVDVDSSATCCRAATGKGLSCCPHKSVSQTSVVARPAAFLNEGTQRGPHGRNGGQRSPSNPGRAGHGHGTLQRAEPASPGRVTRVGQLLGETGTMAPNSPRPIGSNFNEANGLHRAGLLGSPNATITTTGNGRHHHTGSTATPAVRPRDCVVPQGPQIYVNWQCVITNDGGQRLRLRLNLIR